MEKKVVTQGIQNPLDGLAMVFASYYIFNMQCEDGVSATLEFVQR